MTMKSDRRNSIAGAPSSAVAEVVLAVLTFLSIQTATKGSECSAYFGYVGRFRAVSSNTSYAIVPTLQGCNKLCCYSLCAADDLCIGTNYLDESSQCTMMRLGKWQLAPDDNYMLTLKGMSLSNLEKRQYRTLFGSLSDNVQMEGRGNYTVSMVQNTSQCQFFCEMLTTYCYAYQFHNVKRTCKVFVGNYTGDYLPIDPTDNASSFFYHFRSANGRYRKLPGAYPKTTGLASYNAINIMDSLRCQQLCENQSTNCSLFAYNVAQSLCYIFTGNVSPNLLAFDFTAVNWTSYYQFRDGSAAQECSTSYYFVAKNLDRDAAEQHCIKNYAAQLLKIDSFDERTFVSSVIASTAELVNNNFWIGAKSTTYPYDFRWSCGGTNITYSAWSSGEPNSLNEFCVHMRGDFTWNNLACTPSILYFICEECYTTAC